jgi:2-hydroxychromene-2-carboxylate isomerase
MEAYWYFDFASPFSYLQLTKVREWRARLPVTAVPLIARALPKPVADSEAQAISAEGSVERFVRWRAKTAGIPLTFPRAYPFNSSAALRLCVATGNSWPAIEAIFAHLWRDGRDATLAEDLRPVGIALGLHDPVAAIASGDTAATLRSNTAAALALGVSSVPTVRVGGELFSGSQGAEQMDDWLAQPAFRRSA